VNGTVYFRQRDGNLYALDAGSGELRWKFAAGDVVHASPAYADGVVYFGSWDSYFYAVDATNGKEKWRFPRRRGSADPQPGWIPVVACGRRRRRLHRLPRFESVRDQRRDRQGEMALQQQRQLGPSPRRR
jgi:glucose dehydrogenase